jgi:hypothetical protein
MIKHARLAALASVAVAVAATCFVRSEAASAADLGGPVLYVNRHGGPTTCYASVEGTKKDGSPYKDSLSRESCDGTLWMPPLATGSNLSVYLRVMYPWEYSVSRNFSVQSAMDPEQMVVDNNTAICFLAKADGHPVYTNMSIKGGDCNGD